MSKPKQATETHYEVTVWNQTTGDVERKMWNATGDDLEAVRDQFDDMPWCEVVIDREWEIDLS